MAGKEFIPFTLEERSAMVANDWFICVWCRRFGHKHPTGPIMTNHMKACRYADD